MDNDEDSKVKDEHAETLAALDAIKDYTPGSRTIHSINPLGMRVVVRVPKDQNRTDGGLYLPEGAKEAMSDSLLVEVIEVASAIDTDTDEEANISGIPLGAWVLIPKTAGTQVPWDERLRIVETKEVLATVEKVELS